jgi:hypothetical protein
MRLHELSEALSPQSAIGPQLEQSRMKINEIPRRFKAYLQISKSPVGADGCS